MERSVKTNLSRSPTALFNVGVRSQSARAAWLVRVQLASTGWLVRFPFGHASAVGIGADASQYGGLSTLDGADDVGILDEIEALLFSR